MRLWDVDRGKVIVKWTGHTDYIVSVCWSRDGGRVVSGSYDDTARVWDVESGRAALSHTWLEGDEGLCIYAFHTSQYVEQIRSK
jgi:WD40 repeat protein